MRKNEDSLKQAINSVKHEIRAGMQTDRSELAKLRSAMESSDLRWMGLLEENMAKLTEESEKSAAVVGALKKATEEVAEWKGTVRSVLADCMEDWKSDESTKAEDLQRIYKENQRMIESKLDERNKGYPVMMDGIASLRTLQEMTHGMLGMAEHRMQQTETRQCCFVCCVV